MKDAMVAGIWGNPNYDPQKEGQEAARRQILEHIEEQYQKAILEIYAGPDVASRSDEIDWDDPFFAASKAPRLNQPPGAAEMDSGVREKRTEVEKLLEEIDQT